MAPNLPPDDRDLDNPYAPPETAFARDPIPDLRAGGPFTVGDVFNWSWVILKERMLTCIGITFGVLGINWAISIAMNVIMNELTANVRDRNLFTLSYIITLFVAIVLQIWLTWVGQTIAVLKICRGEPVTFGDVFTGGRYVLTIILATILFGLTLAAPILIAVGISTFAFLALGYPSIGGILVFLVVSTIAGLFFIYVSSRLAMYYYLIIDRDAGVFESLQQSWHLCRGQVANIILAYVLQLAVVLAGFLALCVGLVIALPLAIMLLPVTYLAMTGSQFSQPGKPEFL